MKTSSLLRAIENGGSRTKPMKTGHAGLDKLATGLWIGQQAKEWYDKGKSKYREKTTWSITVQEDDTAYAVVQKWIFETMPKTNHKNVVASTKTVYLNADGTEARSGRDPFDDMFSEGSGGKTSETRVVLNMTDSRMMKIDVEGHKIEVRVSAQQPEVAGDDGRPRRRVMGVRNGRIIFTARSIEGQAAVVAMLNSMVGGRNKRQPSLWVADGWGQWRQQDAPARKLESVILREGLKEEILADLRKFLADEKKYTDLGIPWHRGYMFHGPPGTGKTSLIKAITAELGLDLWYAPLGDLKEDSSLVDLVRSVKARGVLLLEDVDAYAAAQDRDGDDASMKNPGEGISSTALLNALDGVVTPHGLITIMTTNHLDKLDPALIRNGRADRLMELGLPSVEEISRLWSMFFPNTEQWIIPRDEVPGISQAEVSEVFKSNWEDPAKARTELLAVLGELSAKADVEVEVE